jgi:hypothetical protein
MSPRKSDTATKQYTMKGRPRQKVNQSIKNIFIGGRTYDDKMIEFTLREIVYQVSKFKAANEDTTTLAPGSRTTDCVGVPAGINVSILYSF